VPAPLEGRVALITGGGSGVGANIARGLAGAGMDVWVTGRTKDRIEAVAEEIGGHALAGDVSHEDDVHRWFEQAGPADLLVNNAGVQGPTVTFDQEEPESWWQVFEINVRGVFLCCRAAVPRMLARGGGRIVNVKSGAAYLPPGGFPSTAYGPSKAAVHRFLRDARRPTQPAWRVRLLDQSRARAHRDDRVPLGRRCSLDAPRVRATARVCARYRRVRRARRALPPR
jgi:NAD(P)-dependent dehydrogenase (short-subunit alcohol dehydrogenase family)